jgi:molybdopterin-containing oxidoreductase family membrane subunit
MAAITPREVSRRIPAPVMDADETLAVIGKGNTLMSVTEKVSNAVLRDRLRPGWVAFLFFAVMMLACLGLALGYLFIMGVGIWGINNTVAWGFDIINFIWWIGIGHAGTLISAILLLLHQNWRTSINRFAEAMTIFAVFCAAVFVLSHVGRHQYAYWLFPLPNSMGMWPQFRSPLEWDVFAVSTYTSVSILFWYVGLIPDLATLRDRAVTPWVKKAYGIASLGWRGSNQHWHRYMAVYLILAGISTPLVLSVHSTISYDFAFSQVPGWHTTIFPPYFVAGAVFAGFAMVLLLAIPMREIFQLKDLITMKHLENCAKVMLATGIFVSYGYGMEAWTAYYSGNVYERFMAANRALGPYAWSYWGLIFCNCIAPQVLWFRKVRTNLVWLFFISIIVSIGMWLERYVIIVVSLTHSFLPSGWGDYTPTGWDWLQYIGTFGLFLTLFLLFCRCLPVIAMAEMRELVHHEAHHNHHHGDENGHHADSHGGTTGSEVAVAPSPA